MPKTNADSLQGHFNIYLFAFLRGDQAGMDREVQWAKGRPEEAEFNAVLASTAIYFGKLKQAEEYEKKALEMFERQNGMEKATSVLNTFADKWVTVGKCEQARHSIRSRTRYQEQVRILCVPAVCSCS